MLSQRYSPDFIDAHLLTRDAFMPWPKPADRDGWSRVPMAVGKAHVRLAQEALDAPWPALPATLYLDFARTGNRTRFQDPYNARRHVLERLVLGECVENEGRFLDPIIDGLWSVCEESTWCLPAHIGAQRAGRGLPDAHEPILDLFAGETASLLAWSHYLLSDALDQVHSVIAPRIVHEIHHRVLDTALQRDDYWWMALDGQRVNNWNPWICSNWLACVLTIDDDQPRRVAAVNKIMRVLDKFIDAYPPDGGCDEGPGYWGRAGASLFDCLDLLHTATGGRVDVYEDEKIRNIGRYILRARIAGDYVMNFADAPPMARPSGAMVYRIGKRIDDDALKALGVWAAIDSNIEHKGVGPGLLRALPALFEAEHLIGADADEPLPRDVWLPDIQVMAARRAADNAQGLYLAAKGGHNFECHNHNDVGQFIVYTDGRPALVDAGVEAYTAKTFSDRRYEIWTMQSSWHNLPSIDGIQQGDGREFAADEVQYASDDAHAQLSLNIARAYPDAAGAIRWQRTVRLDRGEPQRVTLTDAYELKHDVSEIVMHLLTPCEVALDKAGLIELRERALDDDRMSGALRITYDTGLFGVTAQAMPLDDERMARIWGGRLVRIALRIASPQRTGAYTLTIMR